MIGLSAGLIAYNSVVHLVPAHNVLYVPLNLAATAALALIAGRVGLSAADLGLRRADLRAGLRWGGWVAVVVAAGLAMAVAIPALHPLFDDERIADIAPALLAYRAFIRIPFGTALFEEFAFRGVLLGAWMRVASPMRAAVGSSIVFGLWHIRPTIDLLDANGLSSSVAGRSLAVGAAVAVTAAAGLLFSFLRLRSRSLVAPFVVHAAVNSFAIIAAAAVTEWL